MQLLFLLIAVLFSCLQVTNSKKYNVFKSYKDADEKPRHYASDGAVAPLHEYLTLTQKHMSWKRRAKVDHKDDLFDHKWSGYKNNNRTRYLRGSHINE